MFLPGAMSTAQEHDVDKKSTVWFDISEMKAIRSRPYRMLDYQCASFTVTQF